MGLVYFYTETCFVFTSCAIVLHATETRFLGEGCMTYSTLKVYISNHILRLHREKALDLSSMHSYAAALICLVGYGHMHQVSPDDQILRPSVLLCDAVGIKTFRP